jgi:nucleoside-diphosphate-sugar epimerase
MPWRQFRRRLPAVLRPVTALIQGMLPLLPDPGVPLQLVHHDDVAAAIVLAVLGAGEPGPYNLAGDGELSFGEVAEATGTRSIRVPRAAAVAVSRVIAAVPMVPAAAEWLHVARNSVVMDTRRAKDVLGWRPRYTGRETLEALAATL